MTPTFAHHSMRDGLRIAADHYGSPDAEPVLFLHGGGQTRHSWDEAARAVTERGWRAVCADLRGHGESEWSPSGVYSASELANDVKDLVAAVGDQPVIVAASLGGLASMVAAGEAPDQLLRGLVLVDVAPTLEAEGVERIVKFMSAFPEGFESVESAADSIAEYLPHRPRPENSSGLEKNLRQRADGRWIWHWDPRLLDRYLGGDTVKMTRVEEAAEKITCPTLLLRGSLSDVVSEETAERFVSRLPRAKWRDVSRARHMLAGDANDPFMEAVLGFLDELRSPTGPTW